MRRKKEEEKEDRLHPTTSGPVPPARHRAGRPPRLRAGAAAQVTAPAAGRPPTDRL